MMATGYEKDQPLWMAPPKQLEKEIALVYEAYRTDPSVLR
jgi:hypothetical protein